MKSKHLIVVSADALVFEDLEYAKHLPMFSMLMENGAAIERVRTIYPSSTHPAHASIMSGNPTGVTSVISNLLFGVGTDRKPWFNCLDQVQCDTIFHAARRAGLTTAACRWPLTAGKHGIIDYLVPEVMVNDYTGREHEPLQVYRDLGTTECLMDVVEEAIELYGYENVHPSYDDFEIHVAAEIIRRYRPNLLMVHPSQIDDTRHKSGLFSEQVHDALRMVDACLGKLWAAVCDAGIAEETDFVLTSDHGHMAVVRNICPNVFLADAGYIRPDAEGGIASWDAYAVSNGLSAQIYLSRPDDAALYSEVYALLQKMAADQIYGFETVFTREEVWEKYGLTGGFSFVIETDGYTSFNGDHRRPAVRGIDISDYRLGHSTHGHAPDKGPQPTFLAMGPSFRKGAVVPTGSILDQAPTFARVLGAELQGAMGKVVEDILTGI